MARSLRWSALGVLLVATTAFIASCAGSKAPEVTSTPVNGPRIAVSEDSYDFGKVPLDKTVSHTFKIKNVGSQTLSLLGEPPVRAVQGC